MSDRLAGDAKLSGSAAEVEDPDGKSHRFRGEIEEAVLVGLNGERNPADHRAVATR